MSHGKMVDPDRHRITIDLAAAAAVWLDSQARDRGVGREVIVEEALRHLRDQHDYPS